MNTETNELFIKASRKKFYFATNKGALSTYDLWDLTLESLNNVAVALFEKIEAAGKKSFIAKKSTSDKESEDKLEIVKYVIGVKQAEEDARKDALAKKSELDFLKNLLKEKQIDELKGQSAADIEKRIAELSK